jgi:hypothetical protein
MATEHPPGFFEKKFGMTIHERARLLMEQEKQEHPKKQWWYLSYAGPDGWKGGAIVEAHGFIGACDYAREHFIKPWPDVETRGMPIPPREIPPEEFRNRLLTRAQLESFWGAMKTFREYEEEQKKNAQRDSGTESGTED